MVSFSELIQRRKDLHKLQTIDNEKNVTADDIREYRRGDNYVNHSGKIVPPVEEPQPAPAPACLR